MNPVIISFYAGNQYYYDAGARLKDNCTRLGLDFCIDELIAPEGSDWPDICRLKVRFYHDKLRALQRPILWVDVDSIINFIPEALKNSGIDFAAFQRGFNDLTTFNPIKFARTWAPSFLYFNYSEGGLRLTAAILEAEQKYSGVATDDFFLEEGWRAVGKTITALPIPRKFLSINGDNPEAAFEFGNSGNVAGFKDQVDQHENERLANFMGELAIRKISTSKNQNIRKMFLELTSTQPMTDLDVMNKLAEIGATINPRLALRIAVHAAHLYPRKYESRRIMFELLMKLKMYKEARHVLKELVENEYEDWRDYGRSKLADFEREQRFIESGASQRVAMWWAKKPYPGNWGDVLNPYLIEKMTGVPPRFVKRGEGLLAIGSVIKYATGKSDVWGSGSSRNPEKVSPNARYHAVRGPITRKIVMSNGGFCPPVYGDPALLLPIFFNPKVRKKYKLGYIPHYQHKDIDIPCDAKKISVLRVSDADIEEFIKEILECEYIISTSLHGIIAANAYGIPARWATFSKSEKMIHGDDMKFQDYFLSVRMPVQKPLDLSEIGRIDSSYIIKHMDHTVELKFDAKALIEAFPYPDMLKSDIFG